MLNLNLLSAIFSHSSYNLGVLFPITILLNSFPNQAISLASKVFKNIPVVMLSSPIPLFRVRY